MALIKCKECGKEISTTAEKCPHCGYCTDHGRSVTKAKGQLLRWGVWFVLIIVGFVLVISNGEMFFEVADNIKYYKYWSYSEKSGFWWCLIGALLAVGGAINMLMIKRSVETMEGNGFDLEKSEKLTSKELPPYWCANCDMEGPYDDVCPRCGSKSKKFFKL